MKKKKQKLKSHHIWVTVVIFLLMSVFLAALLAVTGATVGSLIIENKVEDKVELISEMKEKCDANEKKGIGAEETLKDYTNDLLIRSKDGAVLYLKGENTCVLSGSESFATQTANKGFRLYTDTKNEALVLDDDGELELKFMELVKKGEAYLEEADPDTSGPILFFNESGSEAHILELPVWISKELANGNELVVKVDLSTKLSSIATMMRLVVVFAVIYGSIFVLMLIYVITDIIATHSMKRKFFGDVVTGGKNKTYFLTKGDKTLRGVTKQGRSYAVISVEMMRYLNFCLSYSLGEGDKLLAKMNHAMNSSLGKKAVISRMDSAIFGVLLEADSREALRNKAENLWKTLEGVSTEHRLNYHIGGFFLDKKTENGGVKRNKEYDIEECYNNACAARETLAEKEGSAFKLFDDHLIEEQRWESQVRDHQQKALENEEFLVYYQPKYDPKTNILRGAEALIRWQSPEFGFLSPYKFIPIFEKNGFITEIDHYMLRHAARDQKKWLDMGLNCVPISVNVSRAHFIEDDLAEQIRDTIDGEGAPRNLIEIELTESAFFDDKKKLVETINRLKGYGFAVSMDDFGSGYSSLNSLKDMPLDVLKLDAEFFRGENEGDRGRIVVAEAIRLAKSLNMRTVAEGVEVQDQVRFLADQDCDMIQGYYYAKPMPGAEYEERMRRGKEAPEETPAEASTEETTELTSGSTEEEASKDTAEEKELTGEYISGRA